MRHPLQRPLPHASSHSSSPLPTSAPTLLPPSADSSDSTTSSSLFPSFPIPQSQLRTGSTDIRFNLHTRFPSDQRQNHDPVHHSSPGAYPGSPGSSNYYSVKFYPAIERPLPVAFKDSLYFSYNPSVDQDDMASDPPDSSPGSPPELSSSRSSIRSSCSSGLRSVSFPDDELNDTVQFDDISLSEDNRCEIPSILVKQPPTRPPLRTSKTTGSSPRSSAFFNDGLRATASRNYHARNMRQSTSPRESLPTLNTSLSPSSLSGSPYPQFRSQSFSGSGSQRSPRSPLKPRLHAENIPVIPLSRRNSRLEPGTKRKTAKELEAEYDALDAEDLPEDAIVWNVPLSPRPRYSRSPSKSPSRSPQPALPSLSPRRSSPERGDLKEQKPGNPRQKSWDQVMRDLSEDARKLTAALESHHDESYSPAAIQRSNSRSSRLSRRPAEARSSTAPPTLSVPGTPSTSSTTPTISAPPSPPQEPQTPKRPTITRTVTLPAIQSLPLSPASPESPPPSKEKEKVLARTRPSWLPPKCPKEERRHLREWEKMMRRCGINVGTDEALTISI